VGRWADIVKIRIALTLPLALAVVLLMSKASFADEEAIRVVIATRVFDETTSVPGKGIPPEVLEDAHGIAVIPDVIKVGFIAGGRHGRGVLAVRDEEDKWSLPILVAITGGSFGLQAGAQSIDLILVFRTKKSVENLTRGKFTIGLDAAVAAGPVGKRGEAATDARFKAEIYSYSKTRGLFAGLSLDGSAIHFDEDANEAFYRKKKVRAEDIISGLDIKLPTAAVEFREMLNR
jgi:lipid-binding SYLF domain-containing protein